MNKLISQIHKRSTPEWKSTNHLLFNFFIINVDCQQ